MHVDELLDKIGKEPLPPVLLLGPGEAPFNREAWEPYRAEQAIEAIVAEYVDPGMHDMVYRVFHADETPPSQVAEEAKTLPFLADRRVVVVRNARRYFAMASDKRSPLAPLLEYLENPAETALLIFVTSDVDQRKRLFKDCKKLGGIVQCPQLDDKQLIPWIQRAVEARGKSIERAAVTELIDRAGARLSDVKNAIETVTGYIGEADAVTEEDVIAACADVAEETVWALTDAIAASKPDQALHSLHELIALGKYHDEIMGTINWLLESAYRAAPETALRLDSRFVTRKVTPLVDKLGVAKLRDALTLCTRTHFMMRSTGVDPKLALELLVIKLAAPARRRPRR